MADAPTPKPGTPPAGSPQPKIVHKLALRTLVAVVALGGLFFGLRAWREYTNDPGRYGSASTADAIAAVEFLENGQQAVVIMPDGKFVRSPDFAPGNTERDLVWQPDGARLYYVSDREKGRFQVFRWKPVEGGESESRTFGSLGKSNPTYPPGKDGGETLLLTSGGLVQELNPVDRKAWQILPPVLNELPQGTIDEEGGGGTSAFSAIYGRLGESFGRAQYLPGRQAVAAIMRRDQGDVLIVQELPKGGEKPKPPQPIAAGDQIEYAVAADGTVVYTAQNFQWPTEKVDPRFKVGGRITTPYEHVVGMFRVGDQQPKEITASLGNDAAFGSLAVSPDGARVLVVVGEYDGTNLTPKNLVVMPVTPAGGKAVTVLVEGAIYEPTWHPGGKKIAFVKRDGGKRSIFTASDDGSGQVNVTAGKGDFGRPIFSPQSPAAK
ncbi:MAG: hypothetical protein ACO1SV_06075 [Fimbriimonas sp.]